MIEDEKVAIIIPVYNAQKYLKKCISSILNQTYKNFKIIIVDDGSNDNSGQICDRFSRIDSRVQVIHKKNEGSVEARKQGVLMLDESEIKYVMFVDADDTLEKTGLEKLYRAAKKYKADYVCGETRRQWKCIHFSNRGETECFKTETEKAYNNKEIIDKLYISCFGISNFPVTLYAKLYKIELIKKAIDFEPIVKFMGDDLSVTLRCMPITEKIVIVSEIVYNYRIGGYTSKFMKDMLNDFISLYEYKKELSVKYPMPQDSEFYMNVELMNVVMSWLLMCYKQGEYKGKELEKECLRVCNLQIIRAAAENLKDKNNKIANLILQQKVSELEKMILERAKQTRKTDIIKKVLSLFG